MNKTIGIGIIAIGALLLLSAIGLIHFSIGYLINLLWPILIMLWGLEEFTTHLRKGEINVIFPLILILVGGGFLLSNLGILAFVHLNFWNLIIGLVIISIGFQFLGRPNWRIRYRRNWKKRKYYKEVDMDYDGHQKKKRITVSFGDTRLGDKPWVLGPLKISNTAGTVRINLATATIAEGETPIDINCTFGEVRIRVPNDIAIDAIASTTAGEIRLFDQKNAGVLNKELYYRDEDYDVAKRRVKINVATTFGEIRLTRVDDDA